MEGKSSVKNWGKPKPKTGGSCARFRFEIWGDRSHCLDLLENLLSDTIIRLSIISNHAVNWSSLAVTIWAAVSTPGMRW